MNGPFRDIMWTDSFKRMDRSTIEQRWTDPLWMDLGWMDQKRPRGTQLIIMWSPRNPKWK